MEGRVTRTLGILGLTSSINYEPLAEISKALTPYNVIVVLLKWEELVDKSVLEWPRCDVLLTIYNAAISFEKLKMYIDAVACIELSSFRGQESLRNRSVMLKECDKYGIPIPDWVERTESTESFVEEIDRIIVNGKILEKPFVEKPVLAEDHCIYVYFPQSAGGGRMRIDRNQKLFEEDSSVRRDGHFIYQKFIASEGFETKLYAIGNEYVHAEAVPSNLAHVSGILSAVHKNRSNSEAQSTRFEENTFSNIPTTAVPIYVRPQEKLTAIRVGLAFGQTIFKLNVLRTHYYSSCSLLSSGCQQPSKRVILPAAAGGGRRGFDSEPTTLSIVFDIKVGKTSFPNISKDYYHDFAFALATEIFNRKKAVGGFQHKIEKPILSVVSKRTAVSVDFRDERISSDMKSIKEEMKKQTLLKTPQISKIEEEESLDSSVASEYKLRCVIALVRHGDRTCKQKFSVKFSGKIPEEVRNLRPSPQPMDFASMVKASASEVVSNAGHKANNGECAGDDFRSSADLERLIQIIKKYKDACKGGITSVTNSIDILNTAIQSIGVPGNVLDNLKAKIDCEDPIEALSDELKCWSIKLKWGGDLTPLGMGQSEAAGRFFRKSVYSAKENILHLHASMHHDLKVYASEDRRCQQTAAAFSKGLLELSGPLPVLQTAFVRSDGLGRLDSTPFKHGEKISETRGELAGFLFARPVLDKDEIIRKLFPVYPTSASAKLLSETSEQFGSFSSAYEEVSKETRKLFLLVSQFDGSKRLYGKETVLLLVNRWKDVTKRMDAAEKSDVEKLSVIGDLFDNAVYDFRHNIAFLSDYNPTIAESLKVIRNIVRKLYAVVAPCEYGIEAEHKAFIGATFIHPLVRKFRWDMRVASGLPLGDEAEHLKRYAELYSAIGLEHQVRTRLYFAHHSHMLSFLNVLRFGYHGNYFDECVKCHNEDWLSSRVSHLGYLCEIVMQLYQAGERDWKLDILLMPGDDLSNAHGSISFQASQKLIFSICGDMEAVDRQFTKMLNIVVDSIQGTPEHLVAYTAGTKPTDTEGE